jgi:DNA-binding CsgD family transcriptional regulator
LAFSSSKAAHVDLGIVNATVVTEERSPELSGRSQKGPQRMLAKQPSFDHDIGSKLLDYSIEVEHLMSADRVLERLHEITAEKTRIRVHGASRFPLKSGDWHHIELGKTAFIHKDVPRGWVEEWLAFVPSGHALCLMTARMCLAPFTWTELSRQLDPVGIDRWPFELALKHGMRDGYVCPVGGRWVVGFWSPGLLGDRFNQQARGLLSMAASAAAVRLERLVGLDAKRVGSRTCLTPRELSVLRHASGGNTMQEIANALGLGVETVRSHMRKAEAKLGTRNRTHTVAEAMRQLLII